MCTAVVGGSIHLAATSINAAQDQRAATPMRNHRSKGRTPGHRAPDHWTADRKVNFRFVLFDGVGGDILGLRSGLSVTLQNNRLRWIALAPDSLRSRASTFRLGSTVAALIGHVTRQTEVTPIYGSKKNDMYHER
jgi:hypothetical protein